MDQFGSCLWWHDAGQIARIGEEEKYVFNRSRYPLLELNLLKLNLVSSQLHLKRRIWSVFESRSGHGACNFRF